MPIISILLALLSLGLSFIPIWGMIVAIIAIIFSLTTLKKIGMNGKRMLTITAIVLSMGALVIGIFKTATNTVTESSVAVKGKNTSIEVKVQSDASLLKTEIIGYTANTKEKHSLSDLKSKNPVTPYHSYADLEGFTDSFKNKVAIKDGNKNYYTINFSKLKSNAISSSRQSYWVMDDTGNVYLNIQDFNTY